MRKIEREIIAAITTVGRGYASAGSAIVDARLYMGRSRSASVDAAGAVGRW